MLSAIRNGPVTATKAVLPSFLLPVQRSMATAPMARQGFGQKQSGNPALSEALESHQSHHGDRGPVVILSHLNHIQKNLALESALVKRVKEMNYERPVLLLWCNDKCVVIGRNQNPWSECDVDHCNEHGITIARRHTGGGAVYHDLGVSVYTFLHPGRNIDRNWGNEVIMNAIKKGYGLETEASGRNDLLIDKRKFSGAAFKFASDMSIHHGTIMRCLDIDAMKQILTPSKLKIEKNSSTRSLKSAVANLCEFNPGIKKEELDAHIQASFLSAVTGKEYMLNELPRVLEIDEYCSAVDDSIYKSAVGLLTSHEWTFGTTPPFDTVVNGVFSWGCAEVRLRVDEGVIRDVQVFTDALDTLIADALCQTLKRALNGSKYSDLTLHVIDSMCRVATESQTAVSGHHTKGGHRPTISNPAPLL